MKFENGTRINWVHKNVKNVPRAGTISGLFPLNENRKEGVLDYDYNIHLDGESDNDLTPVYECELTLVEEVSK